MDLASCSTALRRFIGPLADELALLCRPDRSLDTVHQAETAYRSLIALLADRQASFRDLTSENLFLRNIRRDLPLVLDARRKVLGELGQDAAAPRPAFIQQAPVGQGVSFELTASASIPRDRKAWAVHDGQAAPSCGCEGCTRSGARLVRLGDQTSLHTTNIYGAGRDAFEQASDMFGAAERLLNQFGMEFSDVVRTWIHLRNIERDYDVLNKARREFFRDRGIERRPASTGVQGIPYPEVHDLSMSLHAVKSSRGHDIAPMSAPTLNEAWSYGVDFSRGLSVAEANRVTLHVSGTASIDEAGHTAHVGDFEAQATRMLANIESLLAQRDARFDDLISGVIYLANPDDAPVLHAVCRQRGFTGFPCALVEASLCRPDLLCEAEAIAMLPIGKPGV